MQREINKQNSIIKNALSIINSNKDEDKKVDREWLYYFDKCAELKMLDKGETNE